MAVQSVLRSPLDSSRSTDMQWAPMTLDNSPVE